jgi:outer membrane lipoprotein-sorting protein
VLTLLRAGATANQSEITRKIWFDRSILSIARLQSFGPGGTLVSDVQLWDWEAVAPANGTAAPEFPRSIRIERSHDDYKLELQVKKVMLNEDLPAERFTLEQPEGTELVRVGEETGQKQP